MEKEHPWIKDAYNMAQARHRRVKHPVSQKPYFEHIINVYFQLYKFSKDINLRTAALLHDGMVNELMGYNELARRFNVEIADMVRDQVVKEKKEMTGEELKIYYINKVKRMSKESIMVFLAERLETLKLLVDFEYEKSAELIEDTFCFVDAISKPLNTEHKLLVELIIDVIQDINNKPVPSQE